MCFRFRGDGFGNVDLRPVGLELDGSAPLPRCSGIANVLRADDRLASRIQIIRALSAS